MSALLYEWLRGIGCHVPLDGFEQVKHSSASTQRNALLQSFANGYRLGEVLYRCGLQTDFKYFRDCREPAVMTENYERLHPTMVALGIAFNAQRARRLMEGDRGVAPNVLNALKQTIEKRRRQTMATTDSTGLTEEFCLTQSYQSIKEAFYASEARSFRECLDRLIGNKSDWYVEGHLQRFRARGEATLKREQASKQADAEEKGRLFKKPHDASDRHAHKRSQRNRRRPIRKASTKSERKAESEAMRRELDAIVQFEEMTQSRGEEESPDAVAATREELMSSSREYMNQLKERQAQTRSLREQEKDANVEMEVAAEVQERDSYIDDGLIQSLERLSAQETAICERLAAAEAEEAHLRESVALRQQERQRQQEHDRAACAEREIRIWRELQSDLVQRFSDRQEKRAQAKELQRELRREECRKECREIVWGIVKLTELERSYRAQTGDGPIPTALYNEWRRRLVAKDNCFKSFHLERTTLPPETVQAMVEAETENYLNFAKEWELDTSERAKSADRNEKLGEWIGELATEFHGVGQKTEQRLCRDSEEEKRVRVAVVGPPCAGCTTICEALNTEFGLTPIQPTATEPGDGGADEERDPPSLLSLCIDQISELESASAGREGYVLDGFPSTEDDAVELEKRLTGLDLATERAWIASASRIAPPSPTRVPDTERALVSGLDVVFLLTTGSSDVLLHRAIDQAHSGMPAGKKPQKKDTAIAEQEMEELTQRIDQEWTTHRQEFPAMRSWWLRFEGLLVEIDANCEKGDVLMAVQSHVQRIADAKEAARQSIQSSRSAQTASEAADGARKLAGEMLTSVQALARELVLTKKAETAALETLGKNATDRSKTTLKSEGSRLLTETFVKAQKCLEEMESLVLRAQQAADEIQQKSAEIDSFVEQGDIHADSKIAIRAHYEAVHESEKICREACEKAQEIAQSAAEVLQQMKPEADDNALRETLVGRDAYTDHAEDADPVVEQDAVAQFQSPKDWPREKIQAHFGAWQALEHRYFDALATCFCALNEDISYFLHRCMETKGALLEFLERPDDVASRMQSFVEAFNDTHPDLRCEPETQGEWLLRCEELQDALWKTCDEKFTQQETEIESLFHPEKFQTELFTKLRGNYISLLQTEIERVLAVADFCMRYAAQAYSLEVPELGGLFSVSVLDLKSTDLPSPLDQLLGPKGDFNTPEWLSGFESEARDLYDAAQRGLGVMEILRRDLGETPSDEKASNLDRSTSQCDPQRALVVACIHDALSFEIDAFAMRAQGVIQHWKRTAGELITSKGASKRACQSEAVERYKRECSAIASVAGVVKAHVMNGTVCSEPFQFQRDGSVLWSTVDKDTCSENPIPAGEDKGLEQRTQECRRLVQRFRLSARNPTVPIETAAQWIYEETSKQRELWRGLTASATGTQNDVSPALSDIQRFVSSVVRQHDGAIDWKRLLVEYCVAQLHPAVTIDNVNQAIVDAMSERRRSAEISRQEWESVEIGIPSVKALLWEIFSDSCSTEQREELTLYDGF